jgi:hypothetical protein
LAFGAACAGVDRHASVLFNKGYAFAHAAACAEVDPVVTDWAPV